MKNWFTCPCACPRPIFHFKLIDEERYQKGHKGQKRRKGHKKLRSFFVVYVFLVPLVLLQKKSPSNLMLGLKKSLAMSYSTTLLCAVPSAMKSLTSEFDMGSGISSSLWSPSKNLKSLKKTTLEGLHNLQSSRLTFSIG